jgi:hypothetical protein
MYFACTSEQTALTSYIPQSGRFYNRAQCVFTARHELVQVKFVSQRNIDNIYRIEKCCEQKKETHFPST